eukprot:CAMPEP_0178549866 /NCGR_PEP_ID=MMETSP0697-20121206/5952_1 /TAXON_ID=265572 /ORGANISM="Extubocellulus spinifer, Strain CCMP396" /LENGTH=677 /DNA_ID=CAMNT_0020182625 /DNA_START=302 /DNA_END=2335 /DNA_ORIENTATION=+
MEPIEEYPHPQPPLQEKQQDLQILNPVATMMPQLSSNDAASFLMTLKHRSVSPELAEESSVVLADKLAQTENRPVRLEYVSPPREPGIPLAMPDDEYWLSDLHCFYRAKCVEYFVAEERDSAKFSKKAKQEMQPPKKAKEMQPPQGSSSVGWQSRRGVFVGRVGLRCVFCRNGVHKAVQAAAFPSEMSKISCAITMMQCRHFDLCPYMPASVRQTMDEIKAARTASPSPGNLPFEEQLRALQNQGSQVYAPGRQQYWADSAREMGLIDTEDGIRFRSDVDYAQLAQKAQAEAKAAAEKAVPANHFTPLDLHDHGRAGSFDSTSEASLLSTAASSAASKKKKKKKRSGSAKITPDLLPQQDIEVLEIPDLTLPSTLTNLMGNTDLVTDDDRHLVPDYLFIAMSQLERCQLTEADKVGCYKDRETGFTGMCCKHCGGQPGYGKYYPATVRSLAQTTTSQTILKHVGGKCRACPPHIRRAILALQSQEDAEKSTYARGPIEDGRPRYGSRKVFFHRVWARLHGEPVPDLPSEEALAALSAPNRSNKPRKKKKTVKKPTATRTVSDSSMADASVDSAAVPSLITPNCSEDSNEAAAASASDNDSIVGAVQDRLMEEQGGGATAEIGNNKNIKVTLRMNGETYFNGKRRRSVSTSSVEESFTNTFYGAHLDAKKARLEGIPS